MGLIIEISNVFNSYSLGIGFGFQLPTEAYIYYDKQRIE